MAADCSPEDAAPGTVLDAAALLAVLDGGPGAGIAEAALAEGSSSTVSIAEAMAALLRRGAPPSVAAAWLDALVPDPVSFDRAQAVLAFPPGLPNEPRAALGLARQLGAGLVTADPAVASVARGMGLAVRLAR